MTSSIPGASVKTTVDGIHSIIKLKTPMASFNLRPIRGKNESYLVQVTPRDLPSSFKNSGVSGFGWFEVQRLPGRNAVLRSVSTGPIFGNAVLMWPNVPQEEKVRCFDYVEKLIRTALPKLPVPDEMPTSTPNHKIQRRPN